MGRRLLAHCRVPSWCNDIASAVPGMCFGRAKASLLTTSQETAVRRSPARRPVLSTGLFPLSRFVPNPRASELLAFFGSEPVNPFSMRRQQQRSRYTSTDSDASPGGNSVPVFTISRYIITKRRFIDEICDVIFVYVIY